MRHKEDHKRNFYLEYHRIGTKLFRDRVRYYEIHRHQVSISSFEEMIEVDIDYAICLFEIGKYHKFLSL